MKHSIAKFVRHHKLVVVVTLIVAIYLIGRHFPGFEVFAKTAEVLTEPAVEVALEHITESATEV